MPQTVLASCALIRAVGPVRHLVNRMANLPLFSLFINLGLSVHLKPFKLCSFPLMSCPDVMHHGNWPPAFGVLLPTSTSPSNPSASVRGTPASAASDGFPSGPDPNASAASDTSDAFPSGLALDTSDGFPPGAPDTSVPFYPTAKPPETSVRSRWHVLCDQARNHCRYIRTHATG
jgi:hypothetical protein